MYADNLSALNNAVARITEKHVSFNIQPEQYEVVGECMIEAIKIVLGACTNHVDKILDNFDPLY